MDKKKLMNEEVMEGLKKYLKARHLLPEEYVLCEQQLREEFEDTSENNPIYNVEEGSEGKYLSISFYSKKKNKFIKFATLKTLGEEYRDTQKMYLVAAGCHHFFDTLLYYNDIEKTIAKIKEMAKNDFVCDLNGTYF